MKPKNSRTRQPQNYVHAVVGLLIIALAFYQVRTGYHSQWPKSTGRGPLPRGVNIVWYVWVVVRENSLSLWAYVLTALIM